MSSTHQPLCYKTIAAPLTLFKISFDLNYTLNENFDLDFTASESVDYLDPFTKSRGYRAGTYYISDVDLSAGFSNIRTLVQMSPLFQLMQQWRGNLITNEF